MTIRLLLAGLTLACSLASLAAQAGHRISVQVEGLRADTLYLAYYYGDKQYIRDTVARGPEDRFVFEGEEPLPPGIYLVVFPPDNQYFQILVDDANQRFALQTRLEALQAAMRFEGSSENTRFYDYLRYLEDRRVEAQALGARGVAPDAPEVAAITERVEARQQAILNEHPASFTAAIIRANQPLDTPEFEGSAEEVQTRQWRYYQAHYFDHIDLGDPRLLRTPFLFERVDYFVNKLQVQDPDTLARAIDSVLERMRPAPATFQFYLVHFLNTYARSKLVGMDAVYVHLANTYYATGQADWVEESQRQQIVDNARRLEPLLIGKVAPDITVQRRDGSSVSLHDIDAPYTVLYFWRYDCGHCKSTTPHLKSFFEAYQDRGVQIFAVCVKKDEEAIAGCWSYVDDNEIQDWIHTVDPGYRSLFPVKYYIQSTPQIYVLDADKTIVSKRIGGEQLGEVMDKLMSLE